jgi:hypothetical protein
MFSNVVPLLPIGWARVRPFHDIKVCGGRFNNNKKKASSIDTFWSILSVYDHHRKIMSYNVVKKMT